MKKILTLIITCFLSLSLAGLLTIVLVGVVLIKKFII